ncbi:MAG: cytochrome C oxidase subunit IV family protein [Lautropia sp.]
MNAPDGTAHPVHDELEHHWCRALAVWAALALLLVATVAGAWLPIGPMKPVLALGIAVAKAALVVRCFMGFRHAPVVARLAALAGLLWVAVMIGLTFADVALRHRLPPWDG